MKITQYVREYAAKQGAEKGMAEKSRGFREQGSDIYLAELLNPDGGCDGGVQGEMAPHVGARPPSENER